MTFFAPEQLAAAQRANLATLFALTNKAFDGFHKLTELNLQAVRSTIAESQDNLQKVLTGKDLREVFALQGSLAQPAAEKAIAYSRHLYDIAATTRAEFAKVNEAQFEAHNRRMQALVDNLASSAPAGSEAAVGALTSVMTATNKLCETMYQTAKQAVDVAKTNFDAATAANAAKQAATQAARATKP